MAYRYVPLLRSKAGEITALENLTAQARQRIFPVIQLIATPPASLVPRFVQAWGAPMAIDGMFNFGVTGTTSDFTGVLSALRHAGVQAVPSVEVDASAAYVSAAQRFVTARHSTLVVKATLRQLPTLQQWITAQGWQPGNVDLVVTAGHAADYDSGQFANFVTHTLRSNLPNATSWRSLTLASSAAPKDTSLLQVGRNLVPRLDWVLWNAVHAQFTPQLDYGDYGISHPDLTEPPGVAMARATVSVRYTVDDHWIVLKGRPITGASGQPMANQYRRHATALSSEPQFGGVQGCWADQRITQIATQANARSGSRTSWVEFGVNRHLSWVADRLP